MSTTGADKGGAKKGSQAVLYLEVHKSKRRYPQITGLTRIADRERQPYTPAVALTMRVEGSISVPGFFICVIGAICGLVLFIAEERS